MDETPMDINGGDGGTLAESGWRVKLYELESSGSWVDRGVGHVRIDLLPSLHPQADHSHVPSLCIVSEDNGSYLLQSKIQSDDLYEKQGETMILWKEADCSTTIDYAMSFQQPQGCIEIWSEINKVQGEYAQQREYGFAPSFSRTQRIGSQNDDSRTLTDESDPMQSNSFIILPPDVSDENVLPAIKHKLDTLHPSQRDYVSTQLLCEDSAYLRSLFTIFNALEEAQRIPDLQMMAEIFRSIFLLNDPNIIEYLLMEDAVFREVAGIFEYDRTLKVRGQYRHFLFNVARMTFVVSLTPEVQSTCRFLYRLKYVRDIMLHPTIDDPGVSAINSMITFTSVDICHQVMNEKSYIAELFFVICPEFKHAALNANESQPKSTRRAIHGVLFLRELFMLSKFLQLDRRYELYRTFFDEFRSIFGELLVYLLGGISIGLRNRSTYNEGIENPSIENVEQFWQRFTYDEAISASVAVSEILATVSFLHPSPVRQIILDTAIHPPVHAIKPNTTQKSSQLVAELQDNHWSRKSLLYLIIDLIVNNVESSSIDFLGETMKNLLDFDKVNPMALQAASGNNNSHNGYLSQGRSAVGGGIGSNSLGGGGGSTIWGIHNNKQEKENFLKEFYEYYLYWLLVPFIDFHTYPSQPVSTSFYDTRGIHFLHNHDQLKDQPPLELNEKVVSFVPQCSLALNTSRRIILDILMVCLQNHSYRIKYFLLRGNYIATLINKCFPVESNSGIQQQLQRKKKAMNGEMETTMNGIATTSVSSTYSSSSSSSSSSCMMRYHPQRTLQLYAVKVIKSILQAKDDFYIKHIIKQDVFKPLFHSFQYFCHRDNIITSAIHDLMEYIRLEGNMGLVCYLVEKYENVCFDKVQHVEVFDKLRIRYEQLMDGHREGVIVESTSTKTETSEYYGISMSATIKGDMSSSGSGSGSRGMKRQYNSTFINNENRKYKELEDDELYLNQEDDEMDEDEARHSPSPSLALSSSATSFSLHTLHRNGSMDDDSTSSQGSALKRQRSFPSIPYAKPRSPPHYNRKHGTDLDGEPSLGGSHSSSNSPVSPTLGDAMSIISQYDDDDDIVEGTGVGDDNDVEADAENGNLSSSSLSTLVDSIYDDEDLMITRTSSEGDPLTINELDVTVSSSSNHIVETSIEVVTAKEEEEESFFAQLPPIRSKDGAEDDEVDEHSFLSGGLNKASLLKTNHSVSSSTTFGGLFKKRQQTQIKFNIDKKS